MKSIILALLFSVVPAVLGFLAGHYWDSEPTLVALPAVLSAIPVIGALSAE